MPAAWGNAREANHQTDAVTALARSPPSPTNLVNTGPRARPATNAFRKALITLADNSRHARPWAADVYAQARDRGQDHPHAVHILARAWTRVIWRCRQNRTTYDPKNGTEAHSMTTHAAQG
jgi:hypothetical protein